MVAMVGHDIDQHTGDIGNPNVEYLHVVDSRTNRKYEIPINDNFVLAADLNRIVVAGNRDGHGNEQKKHALRILDPGFEHTACMESAITFL